MPLHSTSGSVRSEGTFGRLRYYLGGCHPSKTAHQALSLSLFQGIRLEPRLCKGGISPAPPPDPETRVPRLPPILRMHNQGSTPGCSKASRGLSVLRRVPSVFARHTTSPGVSPRQWPSRYAIHAGRNFTQPHVSMGGQTIPSSHQGPVGGNPWYVSFHQRSSYYMLSLLSLVEILVKGEGLLLPSYIFF